MRHGSRAAVVVWTIVGCVASSCVFILVLFLSSFQTLYFLTLLRSQRVDFKD